MEYKEAGNGGSEVYKAVLELSALSAPQDNFGYDLPAVEAAKKKHDAIETDIAAYEERVQALVDISKELESERYHDAKRIDVRKDNILRLWDYLQELLNARRGRLDKNLTLQRIFQEMLYIINWMDDMKVQSRNQYEIFIYVVLRLNRSY